MMFTAKRACALFAFLSALCASAAAQSTDIQTFTPLLQAPHRTPSNVARDPHRHPAPTLVDAVISFRNLHNWMEQGELQESLKTFYMALKPGGILGIVDHRGRTDLSQEAQIASGYVREDVAIALIEKAGFRLQAQSEVNANPKDSKDHPEGVWTLPPVYRLKDLDRAKYAAIGESDRFTLRFVKP